MCLCVCGSSGAVHRHDLPQHMGAAHRALLPEEKQQQLQEGRLTNLLTGYSAYQSSCCDTDPQNVLFLFFF